MDPSTLAELTTELNDVALRWADAELRGDVAVLSDLLHEDFVGVGPRGIVLGKRLWIDRHETHALEFSEFTWEDTEAHVHGSAAVLTGRNHAHGIQAGNAIDGRFRAMLVLMRHGKHWRIVAVQLTPMTELAAPRRAYAPI